MKNTRRSHPINPDTFWGGLESHHPTLTRMVITSLAFLGLFTFFMVIALMYSSWVWVIVLFFCIDAALFNAILFGAILWYKESQYRKRAAHTQARVNADR